MVHNWREATVGVFDVLRRISVSASLVYRITCYVSSETLNPQLNLELHDHILQPTREIKLSKYDKRDKYDKHDKHVS